jgi:transcriptional regulator with XRE-family HTH domain
MQKLNQEIGKLIAKKRKEKAFSQETLADLAQIHRTYVSQIERGLKSPTISVLSQITSSLGIKLSELLQEIENTL